VRLEIIKSAWEPNIRKVETSEGGVDKAERPIRFVPSLRKGGEKRKWTAKKSRTKNLEGRIEVRSESSPYFYVHAETAGAYLSFAPCPT
jgi:hypothetical protein